MRWENATIKCSLSSGTGWFQNRTERTTAIFFESKLSFLNHTMCVFILTHMHIHSQVDITFYVFTLSKGGQFCISEHSPPIFRLLFKFLSMLFKFILFFFKKIWICLISLIWYPHIHTNIQTDICREREREHTIEIIINYINDETQQQKKIETVSSFHNDYLIWWCQKNAITRKVTFNLTFHCLKIPLHSVSNGTRLCTFVCVCHNSIKNHSFGPSSNRKTNWLYILWLIKKNDEISNGNSANQKSSFEVKFLLLLLALLLLMLFMSYLLTLPFKLLFHSK